MELYALLFIGLAAIINAQGAPFKVTFDNSETKEVTVGEHLKFVCNINRELMFALNNLVEIVLKPAVGGNDIVLAISAKINADPTYYSVSFVQVPDNTISIVFNISQVRDVDEGTLICRARPFDNNSPGEKGEDKVDIVVKRPLDALYLKFDLERISRSMVNPIEVDSGDHTVKCIAEGSNPAPTVNLYLHGDEIVVDSETARIDSDVVKYRTTITGIVPLKIANTNQEFECTAVSKLGDSLSVKLPIKIKVYDPTIVCNATKTYTGKKYPVLTCIVDYDGLDIKSFKYQLGNSEVILEGTQNKDFVQVKREKITDTRAKVHLQLYEAEDWHFKTNFYLIVENTDGHITRQSVNLEKIPGNSTEVSETGRGASRGPGNGTSLLGASVVTLFISLWCAFKLSL